MFTKPSPNFLHISHASARLDCNKTEVMPLSMAFLPMVIFIFVTITHDGTVKVSREFDIQQGDMTLVLGCLRYILEMTIETSPDGTPERYGEDLIDSPIDLDDNDYTNPPVDDEEYF